jgi:hypothetical protein
MFGLLGFLLLPVSMCSFPLPMDWIDIRSLAFNSRLTRCRLVIALVNCQHIAIRFLARK